MAMRTLVSALLMLIVARADAFAPMGSVRLCLQAGAVHSAGRARPCIASLAASALTTELKSELLQLVSAQDLNEDISSDISQKMDKLVEKISATADASGPVFSKERVCKQNASFTCCTCMRKRETCMMCECM